jgi:hypothetical protein
MSEPLSAELLGCADHGTRIPQLVQRGAKLRYQNGVGNVTAIPGQQKLHPVNGGGGNVYRVTSRRLGQSTGLHEMLRHQTCVIS